MFEKRKLRKHGQRCHATVVHAQQQKKISTNDYRKYDFIVDVHPEGAEPFRTEIIDTFTVGGLNQVQGEVVNAIWTPRRRGPLPI